MWSSRVGSKSIFASPLILNNLTRDILVCTLDGSFSRLNSETGNSIWTKSLSSPIFSSPQLFNQNCLITEVLGIVHCVDIDGIEVSLRTNQDFVVLLFSLSTRYGIFVQVAIFSRPQRDLTTQSYSDVTITSFTVCRSRMVRLSGVFN